MRKQYQRVVLLSNLNGFNDFRPLDGDLLVLFSHAAPLRIRQVFDYKDKELIIPFRDGVYCPGGIETISKHGDLFDWFGFIDGPRCNISSDLWTTKSLWRQNNAVRSAYSNAVKTAYAFYKYCHKESKVAYI